jgi:hypothetical protein
MHTTRAAPPVANNPSKRSRRPKPHFFRRSHQGAAGSDYTPDEVEFMQAIDKYKRDQRRPFPTWCEVLAVFIALGYRKRGRQRIRYAGGQ